MYGVSAHYWPEKMMLFTPAQGKEKSLPSRSATLPLLYHLRCNTRAVQDNKQHGFWSQGRIPLLRGTSFQFPFMN